MTSSNVKAKQNDLVKLSCSGKGEQPLVFTWTRNHEPLISYVDNYQSYSTSFTLVEVKDTKDFGEYICHISDRFANTISHSAWINEKNEISSAGN